MYGRLYICVQEGRRNRIKKRVKAVENEVFGEFVCACELKTAIDVDYRGLLGVVRWIVEQDRRWLGCFMMGLFYIVLLL